MGNTAQPRSPGEPLDRRFPVHTRAPVFNSLSAPGPGEGENKNHGEKHPRHPRRGASFDAFAAAHRIFSASCLVLFGWFIVETLFPSMADRGGWLTAALLTVASVSTLISLSRSLPAQNLLLAVTIIGLIAGFVQAVGILTGIPVGPYLHTNATGPRFLGVLPWWVPLVWIIAILNSRGVARLILRPWRKIRTYGFGLIGLTLALCLGFDFGLELIAARTNGDWTWTITQLTSNWRGIPLAYLPGRAITVLFILAVVTPILISKKPVELPPDYHPLFLWMLLNLAFLAGAIAGHFWLAAILVSVAIPVTGLFALRGAQRQEKG